MEGNAAIITAPLYHVSGSMQFSAMHWSYYRFCYGNQNDDDDDDDDEHDNHNSSNRLPKSWLKRKLLTCVHFPLSLHACINL